MNECIFVCVWESTKKERERRERDIRDMRGHSSISNLTDRHITLTRCLSARGPVWETGHGRDRERMGGDPNSTLQPVIRIITRREHGRGAKQWRIRRTWTPVLNSELRWQGRARSSKTLWLLPFHTPHPPHQPRTPIKAVCVWYVCIGKTDPVMSTQLGNISALPGDVMIHLWGRQRKTGGGGGGGGLGPRTSRESRRWDRC